MNEAVNRSGQLFLSACGHFFVFSVTVILFWGFFGCVKREREASVSPRSETPVTAASRPGKTQANDQQSTASSATSSSNQPSKRININTASGEELEQLPGIGKALAERIIEHREKYGPFRRPEHLIIVRGISDRKFRGLREMITVE